MKYSIIMPYYQRPELRFTLDSFAEYYRHRDDIEVIIVEDSKNFESSEKHSELLGITEKYKTNVCIRILTDPVVSYCPSSKYNLGVRESLGSIIMLSNPETPHNMDMFKYIDLMDMTNTYVVFACASMHVTVDRGTFFNSDLEFSQWYQHSIHRSAKYHFCSVITKEDYNKIGGFDERYSAGITFDDDNFLKRVEVGGLKIIQRDDLYTCHIEHSRDYSLTPEERERLRLINQNLWVSQLATGNF